MYKKNSKGFTLIELLAVITIMGILMIVAIPAVTRTIENARKDTFLDTVKQYVNGLETVWASDGLVCGPDNIPSTAVAAGSYYVKIDTSSTSVPQLLESGGKSPWGSRDIKGFIVLVIFDERSPGKDGIVEGEKKCGASGTEICRSTDDVITRRVHYYPKMVDGIHGINFSGAAYRDIHLRRGDIVMSGATYDKVVDSNGNYLTPNFQLDLNDDGDWGDTINGVKENSVPSIECIEA